MLQNFDFVNYIEASKSTTENEMEIENTKSTLFKFQTDMYRLNIFLNDEFVFNLSNLMCYFNDKICKLS
jgi:hypothetical protein